MGETLAFSVPARGWVKPLAFRRSLQEARRAGTATTDHVLAEGRRSTPRRSLVAFQDSLERQQTRTERAAFRRPVRAEPPAFRRGCPPSEKLSQAVEDRLEQALGERPKAEGSEVHLVAVREVAQKRALQGGAEGLIFDEDVELQVVAK